MPSPQLAGHLDHRFSEPEAGPTSWQDAASVLESAELYWLTTVRADGRPHVTPLIGVWHDDAVHFCTGLREQKARNLEHRAQVALTAGNNAWARGLDVIVEGTASRVTDGDTLQRLADAYESNTAVTGISMLATACSDLEWMPPQCSESSRSRCSRSRSSRMRRQPTDSPSADLRQRCYAGTTRYRKCVTHGDCTALSCSSSTVVSKPSNSRLPDPRTTGAIDTTSSSR